MSTLVMLATTLQGCIGIVCGGGGAVGACMAAGPPDNGNRIELAVFMPAVM